MVVIGILFIVFALSMGIFRFLLGNAVVAPSQKQLESFLQRNETPMTQRISYLQREDQLHIKWDDYHREVLTYCEEENGGLITREEEITESGQEGCFDELKKKGIKSIQKYGNYVMFVKWSIMDASCGLVYCDNFPEVELYGDTEIKEMPVSNWYYFYHVGD